MASKTKNIDLTTGVGTISFPRVFMSTKTQKESDGSDQYDLQFIIPRTQVEDCKAIMAAIKEIAVDKWGDNWKNNKVYIPFRNGDKEAGNLAGDGQTNGEKYPERLGCYFFAARSGQPVAVVDRKMVVINNPDHLRGGDKVKVAISFYAYDKNGNRGVGISLNGVQKISDGEPLGSVKPSTASMFQMLDEDDDLDLDTAEVEEAPVAAKKAPAKRAPAKKAPAKKAEPEPEVDDDDDLLPEEDADDDGFDDLD